MQLRITMLKIISALAFMVIASEVVSSQDQSKVKFCMTRDGCMVDGIQVDLLSCWVKRGQKPCLMRELILFIQKNCTSTILAAVCSLKGDDKRYCQIMLIDELHATRQNVVNMQKVRDKHFARVNNLLFGIYTLWLSILVGKNNQSKEFQIKEFENAKNNVIEGLDAVFVEDVSKEQGSEFELYVSEMVNSLRQGNVRMMHALVSKIDQFIHKPDRKLSLRFSANKVCIALAIISGCCCLLYRKYTKQQVIPHAMWTFFKGLTLLRGAVV